MSTAALDIFLVPIVMVSVVLIGLNTALPDVNAYVIAPSPDPPWVESVKGASPNAFVPGEFIESGAWSCGCGGGGGGGGGSGVGVGVGGGSGVGVGAGVGVGVGAGVGVGVGDGGTGSPRSSGTGRFGRTSGASDGKIVCGSGLLFCA